MDVREFQRLTNDGTAHAKRGDDEKAIRALREALSLWHGASLDDQWSDWAAHAARSSSCATPRRSISSRRS